MSSSRYILSRVLQTVVLLWIVLTGLFVMFRLMPGDYATVVLPPDASIETLEALRNRWGLNEPFHAQYISYMTNVLQLDFGVSFVHRQPVLDFVAPRVFNSIILVIPSVIVGYAIGTTLGAIAGLKRDTWFEKSTVVGIVTIGSFPSFFIGLMGIILFASILNLVPTSGMFPAGFQAEFADAAWWRPYLSTEFLHHYILPFSTVVFAYTYSPTMIMRTSTIEVSGQDFLYYYDITGIRSWRKVINSARHAILPIVTLFPISIARALSGLVVIEYVFNWPGIGWTLVQSVYARDYPTVQALFFLTAALIILGNLLVDILYSVIDPRVKLDE